MVSGLEVGGVGGDADLFGAAKATRGANGEYLVLTEEDTHAKNILFRWKP